MHFTFANAGIVKRANYFYFFANVAELVYF